MRGRRTDRILRLVRVVRAIRPLYMLAIGAREPSDRPATNIVVFLTP